MSSCPTGRTSTIVSSPSCRSRSEEGAARVAVIACGALAAEARLVGDRMPFPVEVHALSALLHNRPGNIAVAVERVATRLLANGAGVALAYADCGTYGTLDAVCERLRIERLRGLHCYDAIAGAGRVRALLEEEPGTYLLTDFLVRGFRRLVVAELGLDRHPELAADYFANYRRAVWLAGTPTAELRGEAEAAAAVLGLPLEVHPAGTGRLEGALTELIERVGLAGRAVASGVGVAP